MRGTDVTREIKQAWTWPKADPTKALAPIQRLVAGAFVSAVLAALALAISVLHVMGTTNDMSMLEERARASRIADMVADMPASDAVAAIGELGRLAGLDDLAMTGIAAAPAGYQSIPLLGGPQGGQHLVWKAATPGTRLLSLHAPVRVLLILTLIGGVLFCLLAMSRHVRRIEAQRLAARRQALHDHLTGLPNRLALEGELARFALGGQDYSVLALDLDRFKPVNDLFGHDAGDMALVEVARRLAAQLGPGDVLARTGGDEFVVIVQRAGDRAALANLARRCIAAVARPLHVVGPNISVGISIGIVATGHGHPAADLLKHADRALYEAKRLDGGAFCFACEGAPGRAPAAPDMQLAV